MTFPQEGRAKWQQGLQRVWLAAFAFLARSLQQITTLIVTLLAARYLTPGEYGVYALAVIFVAFLQLLIFTGFFHYVVRTKGDDRDVTDTCFWLILALAATGSGLLFVGAPFLSRIFNAADLAPVLRWLALIQIIVGLTAWCSAVLMRQNRMKLHFNIMIAQNLVALVLGIAILVMWQSVYALVVYRAARALSGAVLYVLFSRVRPRLTWSPEIARDAIRYSYGLFGTRVFHFASTYGADLALGLLFTTTEVGLYRFGNRIATGAVDIVAQPMRSFAVAQFGAAHRNDTAFGPLVRRFGSATLILIGCVAGTIIVFGSDVVELAFRPEYAGALMVTYAFAVRAMLSLGDSYVEPVLASSGHTRVVLLHSAFWTAAQVAAIPLTAGFGMEMLAWTGAAIAFCSSCAGFWLISRYSGVSAWPVIKALLHATAFVLAYLLVAAVIHGAVKAEIRTDMTALIIGLCLSALASLAVLAIAVRRRALDLRVFSG